MRTSRSSRTRRKACAIDGARLAIVAVILLSAIGANVYFNLRQPAVLDHVPGDRRGGAARHRRHGGLAPARLEPDPRRRQGQRLPALAGAVRIDDAGGETAAGHVGNDARPGLHLGGVRQHPADRAGVEAGRLRLGLSRLRGRLRRLDDLVRLVGRRGAVELLSRGALGRPVVAPRLARGGGLRARLLHPAAGLGLASGAVAQGRAGGPRARSRCRNEPAQSADRTADLSRDRRQAAPTLRRHHQRRADRLAARRADRARCRATTASSSPPPSRSTPR